MTPPNTPKTPNNTPSEDVPGGSHTPSPAAPDEGVRDKPAEGPRNEGVREKAEQKETI